MDDTRHSHASRLGRLEQSVRRLRIVNGVLLALVAWVTLGALVSQPDEVRARRFVLVNSIGQEVGELNAQVASIPTLQLMSDGGSQLEITPTYLKFSDESAAVLFGARAAIFTNSTASVSINTQAPSITLSSKSDVLWTAPGR